MKNIIILISLTFVGCATSGQRKRLPEENFFDLLHISDGYAYKSVTKKDYEEKDFKYNEFIK